MALQAILQKSAIDAGLTLACISRIPYSCSFVRSSVPGFRAMFQHCLRDFKFFRANNKIRLHARMFRRYDLIINEITDDKGLVSIPLQKQLNFCDPVKFSGCLWSLVTSTGTVEGYFVALEF